MARKKDKQPVDYYQQQMRRNRFILISISVVLILSMVLSLTANF